MPPQLEYKDYTIVWIAVLPIEAEAALKVLDRRHDGLFQSEPGDDYLYIGGELNGHSVVIATLPAGQNYGVGAAAALANQIKLRFVNIWFALLVGVAAGLPNLSLDDPTKYRDIRLGDVLISEPDKSGTGIVHYDLGRDTEDGFQINGRLDASPPILRSAFGRIKLLYESPYKDGNVMADYLQSLQQGAGGRKFLRPDSATDLLFETSVNAEQEKEFCRELRDDGERTMVWYGNIGSGNSLMRNARQRDKLRDRYDLIGLEMEAAGIMSTLPTGVIRGVCDYGDRHKTKLWQPYAAAVAAVYAKAVLNFIQPKKASRKRRIKDFQDDGYQAQATRFSREDEEILASFAFPHMRDRRLNIQKPHEGTCRWILDLPQYRKWDSQPHGLLWIKGKPGAGKSTVMSFLYSVIGEKDVVEDTTYLEFFFNARGSTLQHNFLGMLRSLLNQIYHQDSRSRAFLRRIYKEKQAPFGGKSQMWEWQQEELKTAFQQVLLESASYKQLFIFIDALDEAGEEAALAIADYFHAIDAQLISAARTAKICISCRHYPITLQTQDKEICVEDHNHHDIQAYVEANIFRASRSSSFLDKQQWHQLTIDLVQQTHGIFQWISLVLPVAMQSIRNGLSPAQTRRRLEKVPSELSHMYGHILRNIIDRRSIEQSYLLFQWVCLAEGPLELQEMRFALAAYHASPSFGSTPDVSSRETRDFIETDLAMKIQTRALSGGLLEETNDMVQVVHQTVKEFLLESGLVLLESIMIEFDILGTEASWINSLPGETGILQKCHARLYSSCLYYLVTEQNDMCLEGFTRSTLDASPFLAYAMFKLFSHAKKAGKCHRIKLSEQAILLNRIMPSLEFSAGNELWYDHFSTRHTKAKVLHFAAAYGLDDLVDHLLVADTRFDINEKEAEVGLTALHFAAHFGHESVTLRLLTAGAEVDARDLNGQTALHSAAAWDHGQIIRLLLTHGANVNALMSSGRTALTMASMEGHEQVVRQLLAHQAEVNIQDDFGLTALMGASQGGYHNVVQVLLDHQADVNLRTVSGETALSRAPMFSPLKILQLLLTHDADVNVSSPYGLTRLMRASSEGDEQVVQLLLEHGANVNFQNVSGNTALLNASQRGHEAVVQLLLAHQADANIRDRAGETALIMASSRGYDGIVRLLLEHGADTDIMACDGQTALMWAQRFGYWKTVHLLSCRNEG